MAHLQYRIDVKIGNSLVYVNKHFLIVYLERIKLHIQRYLVIKQTIIIKLLQCVPVEYNYLFYRFYKIYSLF